MVGFPYKKRNISILITLKKEENNIQKFLNILDALSCTDLLKRDFPGFKKTKTMETGTKKAGKPELSRYFTTNLTPLTYLLSIDYGIMTLFIL